MSILQYIDWKGVYSLQPRFTPSGKIWPHGEFSLGYKRDRPDSRLDRTHLADCPNGWAKRAEPVAGGLGGCPPLDLSDVTKSHKPRTKRGTKGITSYGRQMIKASDPVIRKVLGRVRFSLVTVTLPPMAPEQRKLLVEVWSEVVRQTLQWVSRQVLKQLPKALVCSVNEVQPRRLADRGEAYLHLHILVPSVAVNRGSWSITPNAMRRFFASLLSRVLGVDDLGYVNVDVKPVRGSATRYMAKYMSKGSDCLKEAMADWGEDSCPSTWWNMTKALRDAIKAELLQGARVGEVLERLIQFAFNTNPDEVFIFLRHIEIEFDGVLVTVGYRGRLTDDTHAVLTHRLKCC